MLHNILDYGAIGDGITCDTIAFQQAIDACGENQCVYVPAGDYMTGSLFTISVIPAVAPKLPSIWNGGCTSQRFG